MCRETYPGQIMWAHVDMTVNKANKVLGLLKRTVEIKNKDIFPGGGGGVL